MHIKMSPEIDKLAPALVKAVSMVEAVKKEHSPEKAGGGGNARAPKYKYADLADCLEEARRVLTPNGLAVLQPPVTHLPGQHDDQKAEPTMMVATIIMHESGQWMAGEMLIPPLEYQFMSAAQGIGSTVTYMRRYSLCSMLSIPTEDDDGAASAPSGHQRQAPRYDDRDDRRPVPNASSRSYTQAPSAADRIAGNAAKQPPARPQRHDEPPIESYGEPPYRDR